MEIYGNPRIYVFWKKKMEYNLYSVLKQQTPHIPVLHTEIDCLNRENENHDFPENMDSDLQNACQSHIFRKKLK